MKASPPFEALAMKVKYSKANFGEFRGKERLGFVRKDGRGGQGQTYPRLSLHAPVNNPCFPVHCGQDKRLDKGEIEWIMTRMIHDIDTSPTSRGDSERLVIPI